MQQTMQALLRPHVRLHGHDSAHHAIVHNRLHGRVSAYHAIGGSCAQRACLALTPLGRWIGQSQLFLFFALVFVCTVVFLLTVQSSTGL